jgi:phosphoribosyl 1,2-cyclic phosphodiesterase
MALKIPHPDGRPRVLVIDCGKSSRTAMFKYFPTHNISYVDAFLLTHDHADAILGLDDIRDIPAHDARMDLPKETDLQNRVGVAVKMPIYVMQQHFEAIRTAFPYLCKGLVKTVSHVPNIEWNCFDKEQPSLCIHDHIHIEVLPVWHGENYMCSGFAFGGINGTERLVYLSDVSEIPDQTWDRILCKPTDVLILDCLRHAPDHPTHITSEQALNIIRRIRPTQKTLLVGMLCVMEHTRSNDWLVRII